MISLSLAKLSTAQDAHPDDQNFQWKHETNNLVFVIDSYQIGGSALQLVKVVQGTQVREHIEIERLITESHELIRSMQERGIELKGDQLPVSAIIRSPLLAIRWQLPSQKVRRVQVRFRSNEDFDLVYNRLHHLGLRMSPPQGQPKNRGSTAISGPSTDSSRRPVSPTQLTAPSSGPSCPPSRLTEISNRPYTAVSAPTAVESRIQEAAHARPSSAFATPSFTPQFDPLTPPMYFPRPDATSVTSSDYPTSFPPSERPLATTEQYDASVSRPDTALLYDGPDTAELPPRRELPFRRDSLPLSSGSDSVCPQSRPSTGMMGPPPLPARVSDLRPGSARTTSLDSDLPPLRQPTIVGDAVRPVSPMQHRPHTPISPREEHARRAHAATVYEDQPQSLPASSSPHTYTSSTPTIPIETRQPSVIGSATQSRPQSIPAGVFASPPASENRARTGSNFTSTLLNGSEDALKAYATQSDDRRELALNDFFFKALQDDNFMTLVQDVEKSYARIGLGGW